MANLSLSELNHQILQALDANLEPSYWVVAEIGDLRENQRGHCYMELVEKEDEEVKAKMRANIWAYNYRNLAPWFTSMTGQKLQSGMKILVNAQVQYHPVFGLSLNVRDIDPTFTLGERARKRQEIIDKLQKEGLFDENRSLSLPTVPQRVAVISSPTAAGFGDFQDQLSNNAYGYGFKTRLFKAIMQGEEATGSIIQAMEQVAAKAENYDVLVIIRGGGSQVDLDCFDTYDLAAAISSFPLPVLTGIGHERDETIADLVAHTQLKTPTAVSEFLISGMIAFEQRLLEYLKRLNLVTTETLSMEGRRFLMHQNRLKTAIKSVFMHKNYEVTSKMEGLKLKLNAYFNNQAMKLESMEKNITLLDPGNTFKRGYTLTTINNRIISNFEDLSKGDKIKTYSAEHVVDSKVEKISKR